VEIFYINKKALKLKAKGLVIFLAPQQNDFRTFCMNEETEEVYQKLKEVISACYSKLC
jgi:hypothetical protein